MAYQCGNCHSLFLKTLEIRIHAAGNALLYKKRCKRCKHKQVLKRDSLQGGLKPATIKDWQNGRKAESPTAAVSQPCLMVSEYTARISRAKEPPLDYLNHIMQARQQDTRS